MCTKKKVQAGNKSWICSDDYLRGGSLGDASIRLEYHWTIVLTIASCPLAASGVTPHSKSVFIVKVQDWSQPPFPASQVTKASNQKSIQDGTETYGDLKELNDVQQGNKSKMAIHRTLCDTQRETVLLGCVKAMVHVKMCPFHTSS